MNSKITVLAFALILSVNVFADAPKVLSVVATSEHVYKVDYKATGTGKVKVSIVNNENKLVFTEVLSNVASFTRPYNFSKLPEGEYTIVVEDKNGKQVETVNYQMNKITSFIKVSEIANTQNKYMLLVSNNGSEAVSIKVLNQAHAVLHEQTVEVTGSFGWIYDLKQVKTTNDAKVTFEITTASGKFQTITF